MAFSLLVPIGIIWWFCMRKQDLQQSLSRQISAHLLAHLVVNRNEQSRIRPATVLLVLWLLGTVALAGPSWRQKPSPFANDTSDLWVVLKLTPSMESDDVLPTRIERMRNKLQHLMEQRQGSATGLVVYSGSSHVVMPPTNDSGVITEMLQSLDSGVMPGEGDALASALTVVSEHIERTTTAASILVIADTNDPRQRKTLQQWRDNCRSSVQWWVPVSADSSLSGLGVQEASDILNARLVRLTADEADVKQLARHAKSSLVESTSDPSAHWQDEGYWLLWPIAIGAAMWSRRGWSVTPRRLA